MAYSSIAKPTDYFNTLLYTGDGNTSRGITGVGFQPDWLWIKRRDAVEGHVLFDAVRSADARIQSNNSNAEADRPNIVYSFDSDGFSVSQSSADNASNNNGGTYVAWNWKANGSGSSNGDGATASTVSVNSTAGFSIVSWTGTGSGTTIGHGLGAKPKIIFVKNRSSAKNWVINVGEMVGADERSLYLNATDAIKNDAAADGGYTYNNTTTTFSTTGGSGGTQDDVNKSGDSIIAYCFAEVKGYSSFGNYTGNGNANGPFIYTGFKPAFLIMKPYSKVEEWTLLDNKRLGYNTDNNYVYPNQNYAEMTADRLDIVSNGFKLRSATGELNTSSANMIYMAFAENPFVANDSGTAVPTTAR